MGNDPSSRAKRPVVHDCSLPSLPDCTHREASAQVETHCLGCIEADAPTLQNRDDTASSLCVVSETQRRKCHILRVDRGQMVTSVDPDILPCDQVDKKPCVVSFIGSTQVGKSFLLGKVLNALEWENSRYLPAVGDEGSSKTMGVDFFSCNNMIFLDFEGSKGDRKTDRKIVWNMFPRIAYAVSSTLIYVTRDPPANVTTYETLVRDIKDAAILESKESYEKPNLIIVFNKVTRENFTLEQVQEKDPVNVPVLCEMFSSVIPFCVPDFPSDRFHEKIRALLGILTQKYVPLPASQWMLLFDCVVAHFNVPECPPVPLCKVYGALLHHLPEPLDRLQQLFLENIPNRVCPEDVYIKYCNQAKHALPFVLAAYWHTKPRDKDDIGISGRVHLLLSFLARFAPCAAVIVGTGTKCLLQDFCHSGIDHTHTSVPGEFKVATCLDFGYIHETTEQTNRLLDALKNPVSPTFNLKSGYFEGDGLHYCQDLVSEINEIHRLSKNSGTAIATGASLGTLLAAPSAIIVSSSVVGAPLGLLILCAGAAVGGAMGIFLMPSTDPCVRQKRVLALMEDAALRAYASKRIDTVVAVVDWQKIEIAPIPETIVQNPQVLVPPKID
ncbi:hypothetical protein Pelo_4 [Pelomyxa schiedti]|nr:hypothetical protein Pelo_4 [Pelomyxa schiedti]